ncbi:TauD/TfdA family dioxygenase [Celeribacter neptunius]|uniref:Taurine catabolism dioxygenase TauD, TfdA family n=1 Tax=Celeribacter neptunius TaxID=588602 RepID=A0A1I3P459_9RHOB|nr:TauD/TfdA family dioxygenase [Celeribacter neptunius]SFJ16117.1 Taurine catabolism dioxygenase TauD, TfdA family [Celeribacter neptunius]
MSIVLTEPLTSPAAWVASDFDGDDSWIHPLTPENIAAIDAALAGLESKGLKFPHFTARDFPLGALETELAACSEELENGRGFCLLRGLPVENYSDAEIDTIYYGIGLHLGQPVGQNPRGDLIGKVMAVGDAAKKETRVYETNSYLPYHSDPSDVVGLLSVRKAKRGGLSSLISVAAIYNEILAHHPAFLGLYFRPWYFSHLCEDRPSLSPIFSVHEGKLSCRYLRQYLELGHEIMQAPLSTVEIEALDLFDTLIARDDLRLDMMLEPGDLQFANNYAVLHSRNAFEDHEDKSKMRKLLRLWLKMPNARVLAPEFPGRNGFPIPEGAY